MAISDPMNMEEFRKDTGNVIREFAKQLTDYHYEQFCEVLDVEKIRNILVKYEHKSEIERAKRIRYFVMRELIKLMK